MAEPQGISRTFQDIAKGLMGTYQGIQGLRGEIGRNIGNVGRYFTSQAPVAGAPSAAMQAAAQRQAAEVARLGGPAGLQTALSRGLSEASRMQNAPQPTQPTQPTQPGPGGVGGASNPINALFAPMFENLRQQRRQANQRYEANRQQVTNIYGQITGARQTDIPALETAFKRLADAAAARSTAVNTSIDTAEAQRLAQNQAALQSMGLEGLSTSRGDIASQGAALAKQTNELNAANWQGLLSGMGATAGEVARADIAGLNYAMLEDLGQLRGAREEFAQELGQQRGELKSERAKATFEYQQAQQRAAAAAEAAKQRATARAASAAEKQMADSLRASGPVLSTVSQLIQNGSLPQSSGAKVIDVVTEWYQNVPPPTAGKWNRASATNSILSIAGPSLTPAERTAIQAIFSNSKW